MGFLGNLDHSSPQCLIVLLLKFFTSLFVLDIIIWNVLLPRKAIFKFCGINEYKE